MSHHEIMQRFKKLFGREEMTPKERQAFFLSPLTPQKTSLLAHEVGPIVPIRVPRRAVDCNDTLCLISNNSAARRNQRRAGRDSRRNVASANLPGVC